MQIYSVYTVCTSIEICQLIKHLTNAFYCTYLIYYVTLYLYIFIGCCNYNLLISKYMYVFLLQKNNVI